MTVLVSGILPGSMVENSRSGDWFALLQVSSTLGAIRAVEALGPGAAYVALTWNAATGTVAVTPGAAADHEAFRIQGATPEVVFSLEVRLGNGRIDAVSPTHRIALLDRDDTPPSGLAFASGGSVVAGAIGTVIGTLAVTDPDTAPGTTFRFTLPEDDDWRFEVVNGTTLKLRDGISLGLDDMPLRPLHIEVSDGTQSAGFTLMLSVLDPGAPPPPSLVLELGEQRGALTLPEPDRALVLRDEAALLEQPGAAVAGERALVVDGQRDASLPEAVTRIDFLDARLELDGMGPAARATALHRVLRGPDAEGAAVAASVAALDAGAALASQAGTAILAGDDAAFVSGLFHRGAGRDPDAAELVLQLGRLGSGESRAQVALDVALLHGPAAADAIWLPWALGRDAPPADATLAATPGSAPSFAAEWLLG